LNGELPYRVPSYPVPRPGPQAPRMRGPGAELEREHEPELPALSISSFQLELELEPELKARNAQCSRLGLGLGLGLTAAPPRQPDWNGRSKFVKKIRAPPQHLFGDADYESASSATRPGPRPRIQRVSSQPRVTPRDNPKPPRTLCPRAGQITPFGLRDHHTAQYVCFVTLRQHARRGGHLHGGSIDASSHSS
jgi:hypothetical protein